MADEARSVKAASEDSQAIAITWRNALFALGTAACFAVSAIFIRGGLEGLPSPLLGVTVGMVLMTAAYGLLLFFRSRHIHQEAIPGDAILFQLGAGVLVGLCTWARWIALDMAPVAVVLTLGRLNVPVVILLAPLLVGRKLERVTARVWLGAGLIIAGSLALTYFS